MEKKKVRIYKATDGKGKFLNKTAQFLQKAQMGGAPAKQDMEKYMSYTYTNLRDGLEPVVVYQNLVKGGLTEEIAYSVITKVIDMMVSRGEMDPSQQQQQQQQQPEQQQAAPEMGADQMSADQQAEEDAMLYPEDDTMQQEEDYAADTSQLGFQDGGEYDDYEDTTGEGAEAAIQQYDSPGQAEMKPFDLESLIQNTPGVQEDLTFPGIESYIPNYQSVSWDNIDALDTSLPEQKRGGSPKRSFVKNVMALLKKQDGGDGKEPGPVGSKANPLDNTTDDVQKRKSNFINTIKDSATKAATETLYEKLSQSKDPQLQQLAMQGEEQQQEPMDMGEGMMQKGGAPSWYAGVPNTVSPYQYRKYYKMMKQLMPRGLDIRDLNIAGPQYDKRTEMPLPGNPMDYTELAAAMAAQLGIPMAEGMMSGLVGPSIHVEDTDMFGRPKKYWIDYNGRKSSELQADESTSKNNAKYYQHATPEEMIDSEIEYEEDVEQYPMAQMGGFTGGENPLTRFVQGGEDIDAEYYEDMYLPEAQFGGTRAYDIMNYIKNVADYNNDPTQQIRRATVRYVPNYVTSPGGFFRNVLPWNPGIGYAGSYGKQTSMPYVVGSRTPYTGSLAGATPVGRYVTKTSMLGRRPKKWVDVYNVGNGTPLTEEEAKELSENLDGKGSKNSGPREKKASLQGLKYRLQGKDKKQFGGANRSDSLLVYNNARAIDNHYRNLQKKGFYGKFDQNPGFLDQKYYLNTMKTVVKETKEYYRDILNNYKNNKNSINNTTDWDDYKRTYPKATKEQYIKDIKRSLEEVKKSDKNKSYYKDLYPSQIDPRAPSTLFDKRISPQYITSFEAKSKGYAPAGGYITGIYQYDPLAIKPSDMLTKKEVIERVEKFGTSGISQSKLKEAGIDPDKQKDKDKNKGGGKRNNQNKQNSSVTEENFDEIRLPIKPINTASIEAMMTPTANDPTSLNLGAPQFEKSTVIPIDNYEEDVHSRKDPTTALQPIYKTDEYGITKIVGYKKVITGYNDIQWRDAGHKVEPSYYNTETGTYTNRQYQKGGYLPRAQFGPPGFETGTGISMGIGAGRNNCTDADKRRVGSPCYDPSYVSNGPKKGYGQNNPFAHISPTGTVSYAEQATGAGKINPDTPPNNNTLVAVENKRKDIRSFDPEAMVNVANAGVRAGTKMINNFSNRNTQNQFLTETTDVNNLYASQQPQFRGDWVDYGSQLGQYRFDQMGQDRSGFSAYGQKGGYMQNGGFLEEDEAYMTDEEIADFIANGGEIEYL